jgi:hypothetical protein
MTRRPLAVACLRGRGTVHRVPLLSLLGHPVGLVLEGGNVGVAHDVVDDHGRGSNAGKANQRKERYNFRLGFDVMGEVLSCEK